MSRFLFIESNPGIYSSGARALQCCRQLGIESIFVTGNTSDYDNYKGNTLQWTDQVIEFPTNDIEKLCQMVSNLHERKELSAVISFDELYVLHAAQISQRLGIKGPSYTPTRIARDKYLCRLRLREANIETPKFASASSLENLLLASEGVGFPCVFKPRDGSGSLAVKVCWSMNDLKLAFDEWHRLKEQWGSFKPMGSVLLEEYLPGPLYSVEAFTYQNETKVLGIMDRVLRGEP